MYKSNYNKASLDNPYAGNVSADYVSADGERNNIFKFIMLRDIVKGGLTIFGRGELVNGKFLENGKVAVKIKPRYRNIIGKDFIAMVINKDLMYARTSSFDNGVGENDTDMIMGDMLDYEVKSNATSLLSAVSEPAIPTITPITTAPITPVRDVVAAPVTTTVTPTTISAPTTTITPISTVSTITPRANLTEAAPTLSVAPTTTISALPPRSLTIAPEAPTPLVPTSIVTPTTTPAPTTIITPVVPMSDVILPYPMMVSPNPSVIPSSGSGMMSGGGGGGSMSGGGGGGSAEKSAEQSAEGGETAAAVASAAPAVAVIEKKIFGMKPMYAYSIGGLALLAAGIYAYKKYYK